MEIKPIIPRTREENTMNYKLILQYDGGRYDGWQQHQGNTAGATAPAQGLMLVGIQC